LTREHCSYGELDLCLVRRTAEGASAMKCDFPVGPIDHLVYFHILSYDIRMPFEDDLFHLCTQRPN
jgi:hypothetical protein